MMNKLISDNHSTFLKRKIMRVDGVMAVNEVVELAKRSRKTCLVFKVGF